MSDTATPMTGPPADDPTKARVITILVVAFTMLGIGMWVGMTRESRAPAWVELGTAIDMPDIVLTDTDGEPYDLRAESADRITLLYFGYIHCPDACPIHLAVLDKTFEQLEPKIRDNLAVVFITTDPARDTPELMRDYLDRFDPTFIGLTGTTDQLVEAQIAAGVPVAVAEPADEDGNYLVGHATHVLVFDTDLVARRVYPFGVRQSDWVEDLRAMAGDSR